MDSTPLSPDDEQRVRASFANQAAMRELGVSLAEVGSGSVDMRFRHDERYTQQHGFLHAGILSTVLDSACGYAAFSLMPPDAAVLTTSYHVNLLRPARSDWYRVTAQVTKSGRTLTICTAEARSDEGGEPFAIMTGTLIALIGAAVQQ